jgi:hypothetical protein
MANKIWLGNDTGNEGDLAIAANWSPSGVPASGDNVRFPPGSNDITDSLDELSTANLSGALGVVVFEEGYSGAIANAFENMLFTCTRFEFSGTGLSYISLEASAIVPEIRTASQGGAGYHGLYLIGSAISTLNVIGGNVGIATRNGETATTTTVRVIGETASVTLGLGTTVTTIYQAAGDSEIHCAATTITVEGGTLRTREVGAVTTMNVRGGEVYPESTGTITTLNADGGTTDFTGSGAARTVTTFKQNRGATVVYDPTILTITNRSAPDYAIRLSSDNPYA